MVRPMHPGTLWCFALHSVAPIAQEQRVNVAFLGFPWMQLKGKSGWTDAGLLIWCLSANVITV